MFLMAFYWSSVNCTDTLPPFPLLLAIGSVSANVNNKAKNIFIFYADVLLLFAKTENWNVK